MVLWRIGHKAIFFARVIKPVALVMNSVCLSVIHLRFGIACGCLIGSYESLHLRTNAQTTPHTTKKKEKIFRRPNLAGALPSTSFEKSRYCWLKCLWPFLPFLDCIFVTPPTPNFAKTDFTHTHTDFSKLTS